MSFSCSICDKVCKSEKGLLQHTEMKHGRSGVHRGVCSWEASRRQAGELTTGVEATQAAYVIDDADYSHYNGMWHCSMPRGGKLFRDKNGYKPCTSTLAALAPLCA